MHNQIEAETAEALQELEHKASLFRKQRKGQHRMGYFLVSGRAIIRERKDEGSPKPKRNEDRLATEEWRKSPDLRDNKNHIISATIQTTQEQQREPQSRSGKDLTASGSKRPPRGVNSLQDNPRSREDLQLSRSSGCSLTHFTTPFLSH